MLFVFRRLLNFDISIHKIMSAAAAETVAALKREADPETASNDAKRLKVKETIEDSKDNGNVSIALANRQRKPKKALILMCYQGKNYYGMQRNNSVITIEAVLLDAMLKAGIILQQEHDDPKLMKFQRAARTDKGVSAVRQVVSLKVPVTEISESFTAKVNNHLPPEIRILCIKRVTQSFDSKIACDARTYSYMTPTFAFCDKESTDEIYDYRISAERLAEVNEFLKLYIGTQNFYNFTSGRLPNDASCKRYIISCECGEAFVKDGIEFVIIKIKGQSFMLHQIRKMVGLTIAVIRKLTSTKEMMGKVWTNDRIDIPKAPGLGLMLEEVHYNWYNKKYGGDGVHEPLIWTDVQVVVSKFREEQIYQNIVDVEKEEKIMLQWLQTLPHHTFDIRHPEAPQKLNLPSGSLEKTDEELEQTQSDEGRIDLKSNSEVVNKNEEVKSIETGTEVLQSKSEILKIDKCENVQ